METPFYTMDDLRWELLWPIKYYLLMISAEISYLMSNVKQNLVV